MEKTRFRSITTRWFCNVFLIIALTVFVITVVFSVLYSNSMTERIRSQADRHSDWFSSLQVCLPENFSDTGVTLAEEFPYKSQEEIQVFDADGGFLVSTTGFDTAVRLAENDLNESNAAYVTGNTKTLSGEKVLTGLHRCSDENGNVTGYYRWVVSSTKYHHHVLTVSSLFLLICLVILSLSAASGLFFIKSIVNPIRQVSTTARKIAGGDLETTLDIPKQDEIGELCDAINFMASELKQADALKNDFISSVSHELRTPLTAIRGWGETAKMSVGADDELVVQGLDVVLSETERLSGLVEDLLDFSRMQTGRLTMETKRTELLPLLTEAVSMYRELGHKQGIELNYTPPKKDIAVMGDGNRLKQVFINIIDNAVKYTEKGGLVLVTCITEESSARIQVKDTGVGIPAKDLDRVKEKFFKSNKTVRGSGIGLAVADEIVSQHNGLLFLESTESAGTTVTVVLPLITEESGTESEPLVDLNEIADLPPQNTPAEQAPAARPETEATEPPIEKENEQNG